jgi:hypothetical protein
MTRLTQAWSTLDRERRLAVFAAIGLFISMFLPWYQQNAVVSALKTAPLQSRNLDAFQVFSFVEAAVLLVAVAVLYMLFARAEGREFNMPGGDGTVVLAGGAWAALLLVFRLFDKPGISSHGIAGNIGVQWGIFFALAAAGAVAYAGSRMRASHDPEPARRRPRTRPHRVVEDDVEMAPPADAPTSREGAATQQPPDPSEDLTAVVQAPSPPARGRGRYPPTPSEQLSFEDPADRPG